MGKSNVSLTYFHIKTIIFIFYNYANKAMGAQCTMHIVSKAQYYGKKHNFSHTCDRETIEDILESSNQSENNLSIIFIDLMIQK